MEQLLGKKTEEKDVGNRSLNVELGPGLPEVFRLPSDPSAVTPRTSGPLGTLVFYATSLGGSTNKLLQTSSVSMEVRVAAFISRISFPRMGFLESSHQ